MKFGKPGAGDVLEMAETAGLHWDVFMSHRQAEAQDLEATEPFARRRFFPGIFSPDGLSRVLTILCGLSGGHCTSF